MTFKHVRMVNQRKEDIPADDASDEASGKAGATETDGGAANETDIGTGMTSRGGKAVPEVATDSVDRNCSGDYQTGNEMTANVAALSIAACLLGGGASFWRD